MFLGYKIDSQGVLEAEGACNECLKGQAGCLDRPYGQGHIYCGVVDKRLLSYLLQNRKVINRFNNNRWEIVFTG